MVSEKCVPSSQCQFPLTAKKMLGLYLFAICILQATCNPWKRDMVPTEAPGNFTLEAVIDDQAKVTWEHVPEVSVRGFFQGYVVRIWNNAKTTEYAVPHHVSSLMVDFFPFSKNFITVAVRNNKFVGPQSSVIAFDAPQTAPHTPLRFDAKQLGQRSLLLNWTRPDANGILLGYRIVCNEIHDDYKIREEIAASNQINNPNKYTAKLTGLHPGRRYRITIFAANCVGESLGKYIEFEMKAHDSSPPSIPNLHVKVNYTEKYVLHECSPEREVKEVTTSRSNEFDFVEVKDIKEKAHVKPIPASCLVDTLVTWLPDMSGNPGEYFFVRYKAKGEEEFHETEPELEQDYAIIRDYNSCKPHEIILVAVDGDHSTESDPVEIPRYKYGYL